MRTPSSESKLYSGWLFFNLAFPPAQVATLPLLSVAVAESSVMFLYVSPCSVMSRHFGGLIEELDFNLLPRDFCWGCRLSHSDNGWLQILETALFIFPALKVGLYLRPDLCVWEAMSRQAGFRVFWILCGWIAAAAATVSLVVVASHVPPCAWRLPTIIPSKSRLLSTVIGHVV